MSIQIAASGQFITITDSSVVRLTAHKRNLTLQIKGTKLHVTHQGTYAYECEYADVTVPNEASIENLRGAVTALINS